MNTQQDEARDAIRFARWIMSMVQGTMGLEGQGLGRQDYRRLKRKTIREELSRRGLMEPARDNVVTEPK